MTILATPSLASCARDFRRLFCRIIAIVGAVSFILSSSVFLFVAYYEEKRKLLFFHNMRELTYQKHNNQAFEATRVMLREPVNWFLDVINRFFVWPWLS
jgi:hypothetical protein